MRPHGVQLSHLLQELERIKVVWRATLKPIIDSHAFWKDIIANPNTFPDMHIFLRMCLALTPSDAVVESAFSRLKLILGDRRCRLSCDLVEQLLILALDTQKWEEYNYSPVLELQRSSAQRARFRLKRADKGRKRRAKSVPKIKGTLKRTFVPDETDGSLSSGSSSESSSSSSDLSSS